MLQVASRVESTPVQSGTDQIRSDRGKPPQQLQDSHATRPDYQDALPGAFIFVHVLVLTRDENSISTPILYLFFYFNGFQFKG